MKEHEKLIVVNKAYLQNFLIFLKHPITALVVTVLTSYIFYLFALINKIPSYYITPATLVAEKSDSNLKISYNNIEYKNIYYRNLIIWNDGKDYIDSDDFINSKPLELKSNGDIKILSVSTIKSSRKDLNFNIQVAGPSSVRFKILDDEALEENDGASFHILYTDSKNGISKFDLVSRVKGTKNGFVFKDLKKYDSHSSKKSTYILWCVLIGLLSIRVITLYIFKKEIVFRRKEVVFLTFLFIGTVYETISYIFYTTELNWLN